MKITQSLEYHDLPPSLRKPRLNTKEAVEYLRIRHGITIAVATLNKKRSVGGGPAFQKFSVTPLYPSSSLDNWAMDSLGKLCTSTSDNEEGSE